MLYPLDLTHVPEGDRIAFQQWADYRLNRFWSSTDGTEILVSAAINSSAITLVGRLFRNRQGGECYELNIGYSYA